MNFKIKFEGLDELKNKLDTLEHPEDRLGLASESILKFHSVLDKRVQTLFNVPYGLDRVRIGHTVPLERIGKTLLRFSLQYRHTPVPLGDYGMQISASSSESSAPTRFPKDDPDTLVRWKKGKYSKDYKIAVRKGKAVIHGKAGKGAKGGHAFLLTTKTKANFIVRRKRQTWHFRPTFGRLGTRTKLQIMYGPSLSTIASSVFQKDYQVQQALEKLAEELGIIITL